MTFLTQSPSPLAGVPDANVATALAKLQDAAHDAVTPDEKGQRWVPGLSIVVVGRKDGGFGVLHCQGYGTKDVRRSASDAPVKAVTLFPCASLSKPVSASLLAHVGVGVKKPTWEEEVPQADGSVPYKLHKGTATQTLREWLSHRTGMPDHGGDLIEDMNPTLLSGALCERIMNFQTLLPPGPHRYTNFGFTMGCRGALKAATDKVDWQAFAAEQFGVLGMTRSTYAFTSVYKDTATDRVYPHRGQPAPPELARRDTTGWHWDVVDQAHERNPTRQAPAGSLLSCAEDLGHFLRAHLEHAFGDFPLREPDPRDLDGTPYSLGWNVTAHSHEDAFVKFGGHACNAMSYSHSGAFSLGAGTCLRLDRDAGYAIAILSNGEPTGVPEALSALFFKNLYGVSLPAGTTPAMLFGLVRSLYLGKMYAKKIENYARYHGKTEPIPAAIPKGVVFRGHSDYYGCDVAIERDDDGMFVSMGNGAGPGGGPQWRLPLQCFDAKTWTFVYETLGENEVGPSAIRLTWENGVVTRIVDDWLNDSGPNLGEIARSA